MGRVIGILLTIVGVWAGLEIYQKGVDGAFGGVLAGSRQEATADRRTPQERAGAAVGNAHAQANERRERLLAD